MQMMSYFIILKMKALLKVCIVILPFAVSSNFFQNPGYVIRTSNGMIRGTKESTIRNEAAYYAYRGIPYAKPPIGKLRFEPPQPADSWRTILDATKERDVCPQLASTTVKTYKIHGNEDCLYLNIYTPLSPTDCAVKQPLAVMVWIHGGGYFEGDNHYELYSPDFFLEENVVVVAVAYRIGIFGFYSTGDLIAPGNYGLKDQILALRWVQDNIRAFGGDPQKVTIFGESVGAGSISFLTQTSLTQGLYHRAIMQTGTSLCIWALTGDAPELAYTTAQLLNISATNNRDLKNKLKDVDYKYLLTMSNLAQIRMLAAGPVTTSLVIAPVIEPEHQGAVIKRPVYETMITGDFNLTPLLMGFNSNEGIGFALNGFISTYLKRFQLASEKLVPDFFGPQDAASLKEIGDRLKVFYFDDIAATNFNDEQFYAYSGDSYFAIKIMQTAQISAHFTNVFFYVLSYVGELGDPERPTDSGVGHAEDTNYFFNRFTSPLSLAPSDLDTRARLVRMWANFAKTGNPTPRPEYLLQNVSWKEIGEHFNYLDIGVDLKPSLNPHGESYRFWSDLFEKYGTN